MCCTGADFENKTTKAKKTKAKTTKAKTTMAKTTKAKAMMIKKTRLGMSWVGHLHVCSSQIQLFIRPLMRGNRHDMTFSCDHL